MVKDVLGLRESGPSGYSIGKPDTKAEVAQTQSGDIGSPLTVCVDSVDTHVEGVPVTDVLGKGGNIFPGVGLDSVETHGETGQEASESTNADVVGKVGERLSVLYLFAGLPRIGDMRFYLEKEAQKRGVTLTLKEVDCKRQGGMNLLKKAARAKVLADIRRGSYQVVLASPPCSTFSRARRRSDGGPIPLRSQRYP